MTGHCSDPFCGCAGETPLTPLDVFNRPGLGTLSYRIGSFSSFRRTMLEAIARDPALSQLTSREQDDYAICMIEMFAAMGDGLTFYGERIANEYFLGTATERSSVQRLVRLIGHELSPGLAATAMLAFELEAGARVRVRKGLPVMSIPGQDEQPQTYETIEQLVAHADLNAPRAFAAPVALDAFAAGRFQFALAQRPQRLAPGDMLAVFDGETFEDKRVEAIEEQWGGLALRFAPSIQAGGLSAERTRVRRLERRLALFGCNAPTTVQLYSTDPALEPHKRWSTHAIGDGLATVDGFYPLETKITDLAQGTRVVIDGGAGVRQTAASVDATRDALASVATTAGIDVPQLGQTVTHARFVRTLAGRPALAAVGTQTEIVSRDGTNGAVAFLPSLGFSALTQAIDNLAVTGDPALVRASGATKLFARDAGRALVELTRAGPQWSGQVDRGGILTSDPAAVALQNGEIAVFGRGLDLGLWVIGVGASPHGWTSLGGRITSAPAAASWSGSRLDVFVRGGDRALWTRSRAGAWLPWTSLEGTLASPPAVVSTAADRLDVVARSDAGGLIHRRWTGSAWSDWSDLGGGFEGTPAIVAMGADKVGVVVRRPDGALGFISRNGNAWSPWETVDGHLASDPSAVFSGGVLRVAARTADDLIAEITWQATGWSGWNRRDAVVAISLDRRKSRITQVGPEAIEPRRFDYPPELTGGQLVVAKAPGTAELGKGRRILIEAEGLQHGASITGITQLSAVPGEAQDHVLVDFSPPLPRPLKAATMRANVAAASHGEVQPEEVLGHGDASKRFAAFTLQRSPLTHLPSPQSIAGRAELEIRVNGALWSRVPSLFGRKPADEVYTLTAGDDGASTVTFGDGHTGRRLPTGPGAVTARYRKGIGLAGRVRAGQLALPLERPVGLRAVANPMGSTGGADPEDREAARLIAPTQVRTFGRAVSLQDFEWLAISTRLVSRATATWVWLNLGKAIHLSVLDETGARLSQDGLAQLSAALSSARDPNWPLYVSSITHIPVTVSARILCDPRFEREATMANAHAKLLAAFDHAAVEPGMPVHLSHVYAALQRAEGVAAVDVDEFQLKGYQAMTPAERKLRAIDAGPLQTHIRLFLARALPKDPLLIDRFARRGFDNGVVPLVLAAEQAFVEDRRDIVLSAVEAL